MIKETKATEQKKKALPAGVEQMGLKEYKELHKKELENRHKQKQTAKAADKVSHIMLIVFAVPLLGIIIYFGIALLSSMASK